MKHVTIIDGPLALSVVAMPDDKNTLCVPVRASTQLTLGEYDRKGPSRMDYVEAEYQIIPFQNPRGERVWLAFVRP